MNIETAKYVITCMRERDFNLDIGGLAAFLGSPLDESSTIESVVRSWDDKADAETLAYFEQNLTH